MSGYVQTLDGDNPMVPAIPGMEQAPSFDAPRQVPPAHGIPRFEVVWRNIGGKSVPVEMVSILIPGDPKSVARHKVTDGWRNVYRRQYDAWRKGMTEVPDGTPLEMWPVLNPPQIQALKALNIFTAEQLVAIPDANLHQIPMGRTLQNQAKAWLLAKGKADDVEANRRRDEMQQSAIAMLEKQVADLAAALAAQQAKAPEISEPEAKRGPGRPRKDAEAA